MKKLLLIFANIFIFIGILLLACNIIGFFHYTTIQNNNINLIDEYPRTVSEKQFWENCYKKTNENHTEYLARLTHLVSDRILLIDPKHAKPTFFENWIMWFYSHTVTENYEWIDTKKAVRVGGGWCSQHAIIFNNILQKQNIESRILTLNGHVLNEVLVNGKWNVYDPDFDIVFNTSLKDLENNSDKVYLAYNKDQTHSKDYLESFVNIFTSTEDNLHTTTYNHKKYLIEKKSFFLIWFIPISLLGLGLFIRIIIKRK